MAVGFQDHLRALRRPAAPALSTRRLFNATLVFSEITGGPGHGLSEPFPYDDAYLISVRLVEGRNARVFYDGRVAPRYDLRRGAMHIHDLRSRPQVEVMDAFHTLNAYLPRRFLEAFAESNGGTFTDFVGDGRASGLDPTVEHLLRALQPALACPQEANTLFVDHVAMALSAYLCATYASQSRLPAAVTEGGFSARDAARCREFIEDHLDTDLSLHALAQQFGMSTRHFTRRFTRTFHAPPYRYLLMRRIARARILLKQPGPTLCDVAHACGFADQSHFTRVFSRLAGVSPGVFRQAMSGGSPMRWDAD